MPTLSIDITAVNGSTATYDKTSGPGSVNSAGDIDFSGPGGPQAGVNVAWTLNIPNDTRTFSTNLQAVFDPGTGNAATDFTVLGLTNSNKTVTVSDTNVPNTSSEFSLVLSDGTTFDPRIINR